MASGKLNPLQERFVSEYLIDLCATAAYQRAGYRATGKVAEAAASRLLSNVKVQEAIQEAKAKRAERMAIDQDYVLNGLQGEAELTGKGSSPSARVRALELLGKHLGLFPEKHQHTGPDGGALQIEVTEYVVRTRQEASRLATVNGTN